MQDYYPFGMSIAARSFQIQEYKYGFNGEWCRTKYKNTPISYILALILDIKPSSLEKIIRESEALELPGSRLPNGDYY